MAETWSFRDDAGDVHGYYDTETMRSWLDGGYIASDSEVQKRVDTERGVEDFEWLGLVDELVAGGYSQESSWYYKVEPDGEEHGPYGLYILRAWIAEGMLDYDTLLARCAGAGVLHQWKEQEWRDAGVFDHFTLLCEIEDVFGSGEEVEEEEEEEEEAEDSSFRRASLEGMVGGDAGVDLSQLDGDTAADRNKNFFEQMKKEREVKEQHDRTARDTKIASMGEEERSEFLAAEEAKHRHSMDKAKMLKRQMKKFGKKGKNIKKGRRVTKTG